MRFAPRHIVGMLFLCSFVSAYQPLYAEDQKIAIDAAFAALADDSPDRLKAVIQRNNLPVDARDPGDNTLLMESARHGKVEIVDWLVSQGANVNASNDGFTPLMFAARTKKSECVQRLINAGAQLDARNKDGNTALHLASDRRPDAVRILLDAGASPDILGENARTPLMRAAVYRNHEAITYLLKRGAAVNLTDEKGKSALILAVDINLIQTHQGPVPPSLASVTALLGAKPDLTVQAKNGKNAIGFARQTLKVLKKNPELKQIIRLLRSRQRISDLFGSGISCFGKMM